MKADASHAVSPPRRTVRPSKSLSVAPAEHDKEENPSPKARAASAASRVFPHPAGPARNRLRIPPEIRAKRPGSDSWAPVTSPTNTPSRALLLQTSGGAAAGG